MTTSLECSLDNIVLRPDKGDEKVGVLWRPELSKGDPSTATVMASGPDFYETNGIRTGDAEVKPGDYVLFNKFAGSITQLNDLRDEGFDINGDTFEYRSVKGFDIWGIFEPITDEQYAALSDADKKMVFLKQNNDLPPIHYAPNVNVAVEETDEIPPLNDEFWLNAKMGSPLKKLEG